MMTTSVTRRRGGKAEPRVKRLGWAVGTLCLTIPKMVIKWVKRECFQI